jgi:hypothetical protein
MGFWSKLLGSKKVAKLDLTAVDGDGDGKVQDGTIWERPASYTVNSIEKTIKAAAEDIAEAATNIANGETAEEAAKRKRSEAAKKAAATRAAKKAAEAAPEPKKTGNGGGAGTAKKRR